MIAEIAVTFDPVALIELIIKILEIAKQFVHPRCNNIEALDANSKPRSLLARGLHKMDKRTQSAVATAYGWGGAIRRSISMSLSKAGGTMYRTLRGGRGGRGDYAPLLEDDDEV